MKIEIEINGDSKSLMWRQLREHFNYFNIKYTIARGANNVGSSEKKAIRESK